MMKIPEFLWVLKFHKPRKSCLAGRLPAPSSRKEWARLLQALSKRQWSKSNHQVGCRSMGWWKKWNLSRFRDHQIKVSKFPVSIHNCPPKGKKSLQIVFSMLWYLNVSLTHNNFKDK